MALPRALNEIVHCDHRIITMREFTWSYRAVHKIQQIPVHDSPGHSNGPKDRKYCISKNNDPQLRVLKPIILLDSLLMRKITDAR